MRYAHPPFRTVGFYLLTWKHRTPQWQLLLTPKGHKMLDDPELKVILVKDKGQYHR